MAAAEPTDWVRDIPTASPPAARSAAMPPIFRWPTSSPLPIYATHSADDWIVSVLHDRGPLARLRELGGQAILDETNGYGHAAWDYKEGNERGAAWSCSRCGLPRAQCGASTTRPSMEGPCAAGGARLLSGAAAPKPARFVLTAGDRNSLFAELTNVTSLRLRLVESPFDPAQPLHVGRERVGTDHAAGAAARHRGSGPRREGLGLRAEDRAGAVLPAYARQRLLLYEGEPLLIVYGTQGSEVERQAMRAAAEAASKSANPAGG